MLIPSKHSGYRSGRRIYPGGKGGNSSVPPPDPALVQAQIRSMGIQDESIQQIMQNSNDLAPLQKEQLQFGIDSAKTAYKQSQDDRAWTLARRGVLTDMQDKQIADAKAFNTEDRQNQLAGQAGADAEQAFGAAQAGQQRNLDRMGVTPDSGQALALGNEQAVAKAGAITGARMLTRAQGRAEGQQMTANAQNALAGYPAMGMQNTTNGAALGASGLGIANAGLTGLNSGAMSASQAAGQMGSNAAGMFGAQGSYKNGADNTANQSSNGTMGAIGTVAGAAIMVF